MTLLAAHGLVKSYNGRRVVDGVGFHVEAGEVVGILGRNGAGKTTSFRMTIGMITPEAGRVEFAGRDVTFEPMYLDPDSYVKNTRGLIFGNVLPTDMVPNEKGELEFSQKNIDKKREILRKEFHQLPSGFTRRFDGSYVIPRGREPKPENDLDPRDDDCSVRYEAYQFPTLEIWAVYSPKRHISFKGAIASYKFVKNIEIDLITVRKSRK